MSNIQGNLAVDLDIYYNEVLDEQIEKESTYNSDKYNDKFTIRNDKQADLYLDKVRSLDIAHAKYKDSITSKINFLKDKIKQLEDQLLDDLKETEDKKSFYVNLLEQYFDSLPKESKRDLKTKSQYNLASGNLLKKKAIQNIKLVNREMLLAEIMMSGQDDYVKVTHDVDWAALKGNLIISEGGSIVNTKTGECYEGTSIIVETIQEKLEIKYNSKI